MNASTSAATVAKSLPTESKAGNFIEQQTPKPTQIQDDAERSRSLVARITSNSIGDRIKWPWNSRGCETINAECLAIELLPCE